MSAGGSPHGVTNGVTDRVTDGDTGGVTAGDPVVAARCAPAGILNFCANNYLGLSSHPQVIRAAVRALEEFGAGLSSVRFICGTQVKKILNLNHLGQTYPDLSPSEPQQVKRRENPWLLPHGWEAGVSLLGFWHPNRSF